LLGSNGAEKTTTIKMLTTLLAPSSGEARVAGFSITNQAVDVRRAIGYVPQAVSVDGSLTGYENLLILRQTLRPTAPRAAGAHPRGIGEGGEDPSGLASTPSVTRIQLC
jgi:ABC-2 type transport system ATP-binding protein